MIHQIWIGSAKIQSFGVILPSLLVSNVWASALWAARGHVSIEWPACTSSAERRARREREGKLHAHTFMLGRAWKNPPLDTLDAKMELMWGRPAWRARALAAINVRGALSPKDSDAADWLYNYRFLPIGATHIFLLSTCVSCWGDTPKKREYTLYQGKKYRWNS